MKLEKKSKKKNSKIKSKNSHKNNSKQSKEKDDRKIWYGNGFDVLFGLMYLLEKYNNLCIPIQKPTVNILSFSIGYLCKDGVKNASKKEDYKFQIPQELIFAQNIKKCSKSNRFLCIPIFIGFDTCISSGHMNILLIDNKEKKVYRLESYGKKGFTPRSLKQFIWFDENMKKWLKNNMPTYTYSAFSECPAIGPQEIEEMEITNNLSTARENRTDPGGFCGVWSIYFIEYILKNKNIPVKNAFEKMMKELKKQPRSIRTWIREYTKSVVDYRTLFINSMDKKYEYTPRHMLWNIEIYNKISSILEKRMM